MASGSSKWPCWTPYVTFSGLKWPPFGESNCHLEAGDESFTSLIYWELLLSSFQGLLTTISTIWRSHQSLRTMSRLHVAISKTIFSEIEFLREKSLVVQLLWPFTNGTTWHLSHPNSAISQYEKCPHLFKRKKKRLGCDGVWGPNPGIRWGFSNWVIVSSIAAKHTKKTGSQVTLVENPQHPCTGWDPVAWRPAKKNNSGRESLKTL